MCLPTATGNLVKNPVSSSYASAARQLDQTSAEFAAVVADIAEELDKCINRNLKKIKLVCLHLTTSQNTPILSEEETQNIQTCDSMFDIFAILRPHWNYSNHRLLYTIIKRVNAPKAIDMLENFKAKIDYQMKLKDIAEYHRENKRPLPHGYYTMTAIVNQDYSDITLEDRLKIENFITETLDIIQPSIDVTESQSIKMVWYIPAIAKDSLCSKAFQCKEAFMLQSFLFLKISNTVIFDIRQEVEPDPKVSTNVAQCMHIMVFTCKHTPVKHLNNYNR